MADKRNAIAAVLAALGLLGSAALVACGTTMMVGGTPVAGLGIVLTHLFMGWMPAFVALLGLTVRANALTITALTIGVLTFAGPLGLALFT